MVPRMKTLKADAHIRAPSTPTALRRQAFLPPKCGELARIRRERQTLPGQSLEKRGVAAQAVPTCLGGEGSEGKASTARAAIATEVTALAEIMQ